MPKPSSSPAEVALVPTLKSCLVNLPPPLVAVLSNANTLAQIVVFELPSRQPLPKSPGSSDKDRPTSVQRSVYAGWTGHASRARPAPVVSRSGIAGVRGAAPVRESDIATVEIDPVFARLVSLQKGQRVGV